MSGDGTLPIQPSRVERDEVDDLAAAVDLGGEGGDGVRRRRGGVAAVDGDEGHPPLDLAPVAGLLPPV